MHNGKKFESGKTYPEDMQVKPWLYYDLVWLDSGVEVVVSKVFLTNLDVVEFLITLACTINHTTKKINK